MTERLPSVCDSCIRRLTETSCEAFDLIPDQISTWGKSHNRPLENQLNSITWDFAPGTQQEFDVWKNFAETAAG